MKKFRRLFILALALVIIALSMLLQVNAATIFSQDGFYYARTTVTTADLYGRESTDADLSIPKDFSGYYVSNIVDSAFRGDVYVSTLSFAKANLLDRIGYYAFADCPNLSGCVILSGRIKNLGVSAFQNCPKLEEVRIVNTGLTVISAQSFYLCSALSSVSLHNKVTTIEKFAFANTAIKEITIPKSVTYIDKTAFDGCEGLVINCYTGSFAQQFAEENGIDYVLLDAPAPTEPPTEPETEPVTEPATEPETVPVTEPATELLGYILGDVDNNDAVESIDATWIQRYSVQMELPIPEENMVQGDVDGDGETKIYDVTFIQRYVVDIPTPYPIGEFIAI